LINQSDPRAESQSREMHEATRAVGVQLQVLNASNEAEIDGAFTKLLQLRADALLVGTGELFNKQREQLVALAARHAIPAFYQYRESPIAGGLISYGASLADSYRQAGVYTGRILKGEKPGDLPVLQPTKFELVINLRTANALGLSLPPGILAIADQVIE